MTAVTQNWTHRLSFMKQSVLNIGRNHAVTDEAKKLRMAQKYSLGLEILARQT